MRLLKKWILKILDNATLKYSVASVIDNFTFKNQNKEKQFSILISAPGGGNIGDQAMLESFLKNVEGSKLIIKTNANELTFPARYAADVQVIDMPGLIYGHVLKFVKDFVKLQRLMPSTKAFYVVGADIMDGGYNRNASALRSYVAYFFAKNNIPARVFGFSWNATPDPLALSAVKKAASVGVVLCVRDPVSFKRLEQAGVDNLKQVADMVFANENTESDGLEDVLDFCQNKKIAIVNASGLISKNIDQLYEYSSIIEKLTNSSYSVVLLPHVIRPGANDLPICQALAKKYPDTFLIDRLLQPDQVKRLAQEAKIIVTGRMHLSIMSLNQLVPSIVLSTQGKVDGLMALFEVMELSVDPKVGFGARVCELIDNVETRYSDYKLKLSRNINIVRSMSDCNFERF